MRRFCASVPLPRLPSCANHVPLSARVCRITEHGEHSIECAPTYVEYAKALLRKAQAEGDPFGGALSKDKAQDPAAGSSADAADEDAAEGEEGEEGEEGDESPESDDLELSFQCFEVARLIYEKVRALFPKALPTARGVPLRIALSRMCSCARPYRWRVLLRVRSTAGTKSSLPTYSSC